MPQTQWFTALPPPPHSSPEPALLHQSLHRFHTDPKQPAKEMMRTFTFNVMDRDVNTALAEQNQRALSDCATDGTDRTQGQTPTDIPVTRPLRGRVCVKAKPRGTQQPRGRQLTLRTTTAPGRPQGGTADRGPGGQCGPAEPEPSAGVCGNLSGGRVIGQRAPLFRSFVCVCVVNHEQTQVCRQVIAVFPTLLSGALICSLPEPVFEGHGPETPPQLQAGSRQ